MESGHRVTIIVAVIGVMGSIAGAVISNWDKFASPASHEAKASTQASDVPRLHEQPLAAEVEIPFNAAPFKLRADMVGEIELKPLRLIIKPYNATTSELDGLIHVRTQNPLLFQPGAFRVKHGDDIVSTEDLQPLTIDAGATAKVAFKFLVPSAWQSADIIIRHGVAEPFAEQILHIRMSP